MYHWGRTTHQCLLLKNEVNCEAMMMNKMKILVNTEHMTRIQLTYHHQMMETLQRLAIPH